MSAIFKRMTVAMLSVGLVGQLAACGTILYPERKGQIDGQIDTQVAILNAIGLLFFLVPGVIAFAVDFSTGAIYLPGGKRAQLSPQELQKIAPNGQLDMPQLGQWLQERAWVDQPLQSGAIQVQSFSDQLSIEQALALYQPLVALQQ